MVLAVSLFTGPAGPYKPPFSLLVGTLYIFEANPERLLVSGALEGANALLNLTSLLDEVLVARDGLGLVAL